MSKPLAPRQAPPERSQLSSSLAAAPVYQPRVQFTAEELARLQEHRDQYHALSSGCGQRIRHRGAE